MMKNFKIKLNRKKLSSDYIASKQDFDTVLKGMRMSQVKFWNSPLFYGTVGLSGIALIVGYQFLKSEKNIHETIITQKNQTQETLIASENQLVDTPFEIINLETNFKEEKEQNNQNRDQLNSKNDKRKIAKINNNKILNVQSDIFEKQEINEVIDSHLVESKPTVNLPSISKVFQGEIEWEKFNDATIFINDYYHVVKFDIQYTSKAGDKTVSVKNNKIPNEVLDEIAKLGLDQTIFITNILANDSAGEFIRVVSMELKLKM